MGDVWEDSRYIVKLGCTVLVLQLHLALIGVVLRR